MGDEKRAGSGDATELRDVGGSGSSSPTVPDVVVTTADQYGQDASTLHKQTRTRRLFSTPQLVCFTMLYLGTWTGVLGAGYAVMLNGGMTTWLFGYFVVVVGVTAQVLSFCEMASIMPVAGAQYYWTHFLAPEKSKLFLTWIQGWLTWFGYISMLAGVADGTSLGIIASIGTTHPELKWAGWQITLFIFGYLGLATLVNLYLFRIVPWLELVAGVINVLVFIVELIVVWVVAPHNDPSIFLDKSDGDSGWGSYFIRFQLGSLSMIWLFIAFEGPIHLGEETRNPRKAVPRALIWGMGLSFAMGLVMIITFGMAMPPFEVIQKAYYPTPAFLHHATGSIPATLGLLSLHIFRGCVGLISSVSSTSRLTWAWARDGGLPAYFAVVDGKTKIPFRAVLGTALVVCCLVLLNLSDESYIAFNALHALASLGMYASYVVVIGCMLYARWKGTFEPGVWNIGRRLGAWVNGFAVVYTLYEMVFLPFPNKLPATARNLNYAGPVFLGVLIIAVTHWFLWARNNWAGPNRAVVDIVLKNDDDSRRQK